MKINEELFESILDNDTIYITLNDSKNIDPKDYEATIETLMKSFEQVVNLLNTFKTTKSDFTEFCQYDNILPIDCYIVGRDYDEDGIIDLLTVKEIFDGEVFSFEEDLDMHFADIFGFREDAKEYEEELEEYGKNRNKKLVTDIKEHNIFAIYYLLTKPEFENIVSSIFWGSKESRKDKDHKFSGYYNLFEGDGYKEKFYDFSSELLLLVSNKESDKFEFNDPFKTFKYDKYETEYNIVLSLAYYVRSYFLSAIRKYLHDYKKNLKDKERSDLSLDKTIGKDDSEKTLGDKLASNFDDSGLMHNVRSTRAKFEKIKKNPLYTKKMGSKYSSEDNTIPSILKKILDGTFKSTKDFYDNGVHYTNAKVALIKFRQMLEDNDISYDDFIHMVKFYGPEVLDV